MSAKDKTPELGDRLSTLIQVKFNKVLNSETMNWRTMRLLLMTYYKRRNL